MRASKLRLIGLITLVLVMVVAGCSQNDNSGDGKADVKKESKIPVVTLEMASGGIMEIELYPEVAPITVTNFVNLVNSGFYDGLKFHRIVKGFMIQGGDPEGNGTGGPGYAIKGEFYNNGYTNMLAHKKGIISMARSQSMDSAGSQFFIMLGEVPNLNGDYAAFGKVIKGIEVLDRLGDTEVGLNDMGNELSKPSVDQVVKRMTVETFGVDYGGTDKINP
jgi:peptidyl-prolyl cis-trans isomerase B (cyclophilin B)